MRRGDVGDHEARVGAAQPRQPLGLADHPAGATPGRQRAVTAFPEPPRGPAGGGASPPGLVQRLAEPRFQAGVAREPEHVPDAGVLAPAEGLLAAEPGIAAHPDPGPGPASADLRHDPRQFVHRARRRIDIGRPQPGAQHMLAAGHVQREIAVVPVVAVEEPPLLAAVQRVVGGVEIEHDLRRRGGMGLQEQVHQQPVHRVRVSDDPLVAVPGRRFRHAELQPVQRARPRQRMPPVPRPSPPFPVTSVHPLASAKALSARSRSWSLRSS